MDNKRSSLSLSPSPLSLFYYQDMEHLLTPWLEIVLESPGSTKYVLTFSECQAYLRLHHSFETKVLLMLEKWADDRKKALHRKLVSSCSCTETEQSQKDAVY